MGKLLIVIVVLVVIGLLLFGPYIGVRNTLVTKNEAVKAAWSQVDIVLQRRADLIPNLVNTVKGFAAQEQAEQTIRISPARYFLTGSIFSGLTVTITGFPHSGQATAPVVRAC